MARLVAWGNHQRPGVDYCESFSPVTRLESIRTLLALAAFHNLDIIQFDYLHGTLKEGRYMEQPEKHTAPGKGDCVCRVSMV
jgi:hypothetical protein